MKVRRGLQQLNKVIKNQLKVCLITMDSILDKEELKDDQLDHLVHIIRCMPTLLRIMRLANYDTYEAFNRNNAVETQIMSMVRVLTIMEQSKSYI